MKIHCILFSIPNIKNIMKDSFAIAVEKGYMNNLKNKFIYPNHHIDVIQLIG
jgi:hypothetical protein